jgi:cytochrome c1
MLSRKSKFIAVLSLIAFVFCSFASFGFADDDRDNGYHQRRYDKYENSRGYEKRNWHHENKDRDKEDRDDDGHDDDPVVTDPVVTDPVVTDPVVTDPVVTDPVVTDPVVTDPVVTDPVVTDPVVTLDGAALYTENCAMCHGQANYGKNVPSNHIGTRVNLTQDEINAINAL